MTDPHLLNNFFNRDCNPDLFMRSLVMMGWSWTKTYHVSKRGTILHPIYSTLINIVNISDEPGLGS